jgi:hypothetical protein
MLPAISDTHPAAEKVQFDAFRAMSPEQKMNTLLGMIEAGHILAMAGLSMRFPQEGPELLRRRLASLLLGSELAQKVYGPELPYPQN